MLGNIINQIESYNPNADLSVVVKAYNFAEMAHSNAQTRFSGERYFVHPYNVALILADLHVDVQTIAAGLLHDVVEDTGITYDEIKKEFGEEIANMVDGVTKLSKVKYRNKEERQAESLRKMIVAMSKDIRVVIIKLADRLHNIRTLQYMPVEKQYQKAMETIEIYAPIANRLGMASIKWELEDLSLKYIDPEGYEDLLKKVQEKSEKRKDYISHIIDVIQEKLAESGMEADIKGRPKSLYSIYKKMYHKNRSFEQIYDLIAIRIIVDNIKDCYGALGIVHTLWKPVPGRFKDYIAMPKPNMYQSLHTTVIGPEGEPFEIQIRTLEMHRTAEYGIAAHWKYKEGIDESTNYEEKLNWLRQMLEWQQDTNDPQEFMEALKIDLYTDEVFVFTPKGDVVNLPTGSTPVDFAYAIHSAIGNKMMGARVNGEIVKLGYILQNGDIVEILTSANVHGPSRDWLKIVKSSQARNKINQWFKRENREENLLRGKEAIDRELKKQGLAYNQLFKNEWIEIMLKKYNFNSMDDMLSAVGYGGIGASKIVAKLKEEYRKTLKPEDLAESPDQDLIAKQEKDKKKKPVPENGVIVKGIDNCLVRLSRCCNPVPGDAIIGYITRGRGVSVHRADCVNLSDSSVDPRRMIEVNWVGEHKASYNTEIQIVARDRPSILADITNAVAEIKLNVTAINARTARNKIIVINMNMDIQDTQQLDKVIKYLKRLQDVVDVFRVNA